MMRATGKGILAVALMFSSICQARAAILGFETSEGITPTVFTSLTGTGYGGFDWQGLGTYDPSFYSLPAPGKTGAQLAANDSNPSSISLASGSFTLNSADFIEINGSPSIISITGNLLGGGTVNAVVAAGGPNHFIPISTWSGLTSLTFNSAGGGFGLDQFDFDIDPPAGPSGVPEPASLSMLALGCIGFGGSAIRKRVVRQKTGTTV